MKNIKIVKYEHKYAAATAVMWQNSSKGWNGETFFTTKQAVITEEENSICLNVWLALSGKLVVGYCNLFEYQADTGALYIGLLNVRDDHHGQKIGKVLALKAVERTIELGWERLDLYTWTGNTKAVPLYKKTGFFWEDRDDTTHLVNFIPSVLNNELLKEYFKDIDWYEDSIRKIEVKPDGRKENEFEYLTYEWEKGGKHLLAEFCRRGRGLRKIETNEFAITVTAEDLKLVFGDKYKIKYEIENKTKIPLKIEIKGINEKNIKFDFSKKFSVKKSETIEAEFFVEAIEKEQNTWKTHPNVISEISVNGKKSLFKIGIDPKFPAKISLVQTDGICYKDVETEMFIDIENCFKEDAVFSFELPNTDCVSFQPKKFKIALKSQEKKSIPIKYFLKKGCIYVQEVEVKVVKQNSDFIFKRKLESFFPTYTDMFYGKRQDFHIISNGKYVLYFRYKDHINRAFFMDYAASGRIFFNYPKLGKPYRDEFNKRLYDKVEYTSEGSVSRFTVYYSSEEIKGLKFKNIFELSANGILKTWLEFEFYGKNKCQKDIQMKYSVGVPFAETVMHYDGKLVETKSDVKNEPMNWDCEKFTEPWIFSKQDEITVGVIWNDDNPLQLGDWEKFFEFDLGKMKAGAKFSTKPIICSINTFQNYKELRNYAQKKKLKNDRTKESFHFEINDGNPFVNENITLSIHEFKNINVKGNIVITSQKGSLIAVSGRFTENRELILESHLTENKGIDVAEMKAELENLKFSRNKAFFPIGKGKIDYSKSEDRHEVCNGIISLKASDKFGPALYSMKYKEKEWLDSSYPTPIAKSWWKPWIGGIYLSPPQAQIESIIKEKYSVKFVEKQDTSGNKWSGLCIEFTFKKNEKFKGLKVKQYFLLLPKVPVVFSIAEVMQNTGRYISNQYMQAACFLKPDEVFTDSSFLRKAENCDDVEIIVGDKMQNRQTKECAIFKSKNRKEILHIKSVSNRRDIYMLLDTSVISAWIGDMMKAKNGETVFINPHFYIFNEEVIDDSVLVDLENIRFE